MRRIVLIMLMSILAACATRSADRDGFYTVKRGDTLFSIARHFGYSHNEIAEWNKLSDASQISVGQVLRVRPAGSRGASASRARASSRSTTGSRKSDAVVEPDTAATSAERLDWGWPATGNYAASTDRNKVGIDITGASGQPILAAAAGKVTYAGSGIRGYGNMIIIKHSSTWLSVYAHNKSILVKEGQTVTKGQKIAEMGNTDSNTVKLYFEIRRDGKTVSPVSLLPAR